MVFVFCQVTNKYIPRGKRKEKLPEQVKSTGIIQHVGPVSWNLSQILDLEKHISLGFNLTRSHRFLGTSKK